ncbi:MAG: transcriptional regulator [Candidatus Altiarchaeales archaeon ex4484_2]|nr:MAG: transcriptional regulator [Candidatus Altiarchaeales archaeon ex4484_2]
MDLPSLTEIKKYRKKLGITQTELAKKAGISQSLIARVEAGTVDPRYSKIESIFSALNELKKEEIRVEEIMSLGVVRVTPQDSISRAIALMEEHNVSQLPVFRRNQVVGSISDEMVLKQISGGVDIKDMPSRKVKDFMEESFPFINPTSPLSMVSKLLEHNNAVLVVAKGKVKGIVTNADLLKVLR